MPDWKSPEEASVWWASLAEVRDELTGVESHLAAVDSRLLEIAKRTSVMLLYAVAFAMPPDEKRIHIMTKLKDCRSQIDAAIDENEVHRLAGNFLSETLGYEKSD